MDSILPGSEEHTGRVVYESLMLLRWYTLQLQTVTGDSWTSILKPRNGIIARPVKRRRGLHRIMNRLVNVKTAGDFCSLRPEIRLHRNRIEYILCTGFDRWKMVLYVDLIADRIVKQTRRGSVESTLATLRIVYPMIYRYPRYSCFLYTM